MSIDKVVQQVSQSKNHVNVDEETNKAMRKAAAMKGLSSKKDTTLEKTESVGEQVSKVNKQSSGDGIQKGSDVDSGGDSSTVNRLGLKAGGDSGDLQKGISSLGSTDAAGGAMNGAIQAGMMSGGNPYAMAGGALMGLLQSRENKKKAQQMVEATKFIEKQKAEQRKEAAMEGLRGDIGKAFRGASKGVVI